MNRFGEIADELTDLIEDMDRPDLAAWAGPLKLVLERAFASACEAERALRHSTESWEDEAAPPRRRVAGGPDLFETAHTATIIPLPRAWHGPSPRPA